VSILEADRSSPTLRVLVVAWDIPYPPDQGGRIRSLFLLKALRDVASVSVLAFATAAEDRTRGDPLRALGFRLEVVPSRTIAFRWWHHLVRTQPLLLQRYASPEMRRVLAARMAEGRFDLVLADGLLAAPAATTIRGVPVVYQAHNIEAEVYRRTLAVAPLSGRARVAARLDCLKTEWSERRVVRAFRFITAVSERDRDVLERWNPRASIRVVPNGIDVESFRPEPGPAPEPGALVFTGLLSYPPNRDATLFFARQVLPRIRSAVPTAKWYVVGRADPDLAATLAAEPGVVCTGYVDDVREYLRRAEVAVVPLRAGGGTRLKILEAMAMARPVVATSLGAEGLPFRDGVEIRLADTPEAFAAAAIELLRHPAAARRLATAGRRAVLSAHDWRQIATDYREVILEFGRAGRTSDGSRLSSPAA
jgi:sugar transferase (PEP-CTERM/EpsH1 system associated)